MLLQNNCINNSVANGLKQKNKKKAYKTALYGKTKEWRDTWSVSLIRGHIQNIAFNCNNTTQDKKKARKTFIDEGKGA